MASLKSQVSKLIEQAIKLNNIKNGLICILILLTNLGECARSKYSVDLDPQDLIKLDRQVSSLFNTEKWQLDKHNISFEYHLYNALRLARHTLSVIAYDAQYSSHELANLSKSPTLVNDKSCSNQLAFLVHNMQQRQKKIEIPLSVFDFLDASGHTGSGVLNGNQFWYGAESSCDRAHVRADTLTDIDSPVQLGESFKGRNCIAHLKSRNWPISDKYFDDGLAIRIGVCLPQSCHTSVFEQSTMVKKQVDYLVKANQVAPFNEEPFYVSYLYCYPDKDSPARQWTLGAKLFFASLALWTSIFIYLNARYNRARREILLKAMNGKLAMEQPDVNSNNLKQSDDNDECKLVRNDGDHDEHNDDDDDKWTQKIPSEIEIESKLSRQIPLCHIFSIRVNCNRLFADRPQKTVHHHQSGKAKYQPKQTDNQNGDGVEKKPIILADNKINLGVLDGLRVLGTFFIIISHVWLMMHGLLTDIRYWDRLMTSVTPTVLFNSLHVVTLFFIVGSLVATYIILLKLNHNKPYDVKFWLMTIFLRYSRLIPLQLVTFWFAKHVAYLLGDGVTWYDYRTDDQNSRTYCALEPWSSVLLPHHHFRTPNGCMPQAWYLATDFRLFLSLHVYITLLVTKPKAAISLIVMCIIASLVWLFETLRSTPIDLQMIIMRQPHSFAATTDRLSQTYTSVMSRASGYLLGILLGYFLYKYKRNESSAKLPRFLRRNGFSVSVILCLFVCVSTILLESLFGITRSTLDQYVGVKLAASIIVGMKFLMELSLCLFLVVVITGYGPSWLEILLSNKFMRIMANLSYGVFIFHMEFIFQIYFVHSETREQLLYIMALGIFFISYLFSLIVHIFFEMPVYRLTMFLGERLVSAK